MTSAPSFLDRYDTVVTPVTVGEHRFQMLRPRSADDLLDEAELDPLQRVPYWAEIWPSSLVLARRLAAEDGRGKRLLELGCGVGVAALTAARAGFDVLASDYFEPALQFVEHNAERNRVAGVTTRLVDWKELPGDLGTFDRIAAADVLYERGNGALVAGAIARLLAPEGLAIVTDPRRMLAESFRQECADAGLAIECAAQEVQPDGPRTLTIDRIELRLATR